MNKWRDLVEAALDASTVVASHGLHRFPFSLLLMGGRVVVGRELSVRGSIAVGNLLWSQRPRVHLSTSHDNHSTCHDFFSDLFLWKFLFSSDFHFVYFYHLRTYFNFLTVFQFSLECCYFLALLRNPYNMCALDSALYILIICTIYTQYRSGTEPLKVIETVAFLIFKELTKLNISTGENGIIKKENLFRKQLNYIERKIAEKNFFNVFYNFNF